MSSALHLSAGLVYMGSAQQISTGERRIKDTQDQHWEDIQQNRNKLRASSSRRLFFFLALGSHLLRVRWYHKHHCIHFVSISRLGDHITSGRRSGILVRRPWSTSGFHLCSLGCKRPGRAALRLECERCYGGLERWCWQTARRGGVAACLGGGPKSLTALRASFDLMSCEQRCCPQCMVFVWLFSN